MLMIGRHCPAGAGENRRLKDRTKCFAFTGYPMMTQYDSQFKIEISVKICSILLKGAIEERDHEREDLGPRSAIGAFPGRGGKRCR